MSVSRFNTRLFALCGILASLSLAQSANACNVPVFRYALERWTADPYQVVLFHHGELSPELQSVVDVFTPAEGQKGHSANVEFRSVDVTKIDNTNRSGRQDEKLWQALGRQDESPRLVTYYPLSIPNPVPILQAAPSPAVATALLSSPIRKELADRVIKGDTAVWVFLGCSDENKNTVAWDNLQAGIKRAHKEIELPPPDPKDIADGLISVDQATLKIRFSTLKLDRTSAAESALAAMLLHSEADLLDEEYRDEPMAFAVFGRGRSLPALVGNGVAESTVLADCQFLCGACTCELKGQNPGFDLLVSQDWESLINPQIAIDTSVAPLPSLGGFKESPTDVAPDAKPATDEQNAGKTESTGHAGDESTDGSAGEQQGATDDAHAATTRAETPITGFSLTTPLLIVGAVLLGVLGIGAFLWKAT